MAGLRVAIPNKGRLELATASLLRQAGLGYEKTDRALSVPVRNMDVELLFVRTEDVCELVEDGVATLGVTGLDLLTESGANLAVLAHLGYGRCRLAAAVPSTSEVAGIDGFAGLRIATSHPRTTERFFGEKGIEIKTVPLRARLKSPPSSISPTRSSTWCRAVRRCSSTGSGRLRRSSSPRRSLSGQTTSSAGRTTFPARSSPCSPLW